MASTEEGQRTAAGVAGIAHGTKIDRREKAPAGSWLMLAHLQRHCEQTQFLLSRQKKPENYFLAMTQS